MSTGYYPKREKVGLEDLFKGLVTASHILSNHGILDAYGHIYVRSPDNKNTFYMSCVMPPALVTLPDEIIEYRVDTADPVEKNSTKPHFSERFIHSEMYKRFPVINSVVHSHAIDVLPYCVSGVPLRNTVNLASFLGTSVPLWNASRYYATGAKHNFLVSDTSLGASLAATFKPATSAGFIYSKVRSALPTQLDGSTAEAQLEPDHAVVLQQGHGFTTIAHGIEEAVYQAIYTQIAARTHTQALLVQNAYTGYALEGKVDVEAGGKIKSGKATADDGLKYLKEKESHDTWETMNRTVMRPWKLWAREVGVNPLHQNKCPRGAD